MSESWILIAADTVGVAFQSESLLVEAGFRLKWSTGLAQVLANIADLTVEFMVVDASLSFTNTRDLLAQTRLLRPGLPVLVMADSGSMEAAVDLLHHGADGLLLAPFQEDGFLRAIEQHRLYGEQRRLQFSTQQFVPLYELVEHLHACSTPKQLANRLAENLVDKFYLSFAGVYEVRKWEKTESVQLHSIATYGNPELKEFFKRFPWLNLHSLSDLSFNPRVDPARNPELYSVLRELDLDWFLMSPLDAGDPVWIVAIAGCGLPLNDGYFSILARLAAGALALVRSTGELAKRVQELERARQTMVVTEKRDTAGRLAVMIAHELNNPLQALLSAVELAERVELNQADRDRYLGRARAQITRLKTIVNRMQELYRPDTRDVQLMDVHIPIRKVLELLEGQLQRANIIVHLDLSPRLEQVPLVPGQIAQVLLNLIMNAIEAMPQGGQIWVTTNPVRSEEDSKGVEITIEDSGPGIPRSVRSQLFDPFVSTKEGGTGLGLAASYGIILAHGGTLELIEKQGRGACFRIQFLQGEGS